jgi:hypothetical protein
MGVSIVVDQGLGKMIYGGRWWGRRTKVGTKGEGVIFNTDGKDTGKDQKALTCRACDGT